MSEQLVPSAVAQRIVVKFVTNENVKPSEILMKLRAKCGGETLSRIQVCMTRESHLKKAKDRLKTYEATPSAGMLWPALFEYLKASCS
jgi:hypothetical protein